MIKSFKCKDTKALSKGQCVKGFVNIENVPAQRIRKAVLGERSITADIKGDFYAKRHADEN